MSGGDPELMAEMIDIFNSQVVEMGAEMQKLLNEQEYQNLGKLAHKAKTSVAIMGMNDLAEELKNLELHARELKHIERYQYIIESFIVETEEAIKELTDFKKSLS